MAAASITFTDTGLAGGTHSYFVRVADPFGNTVNSPTVNITITGSGNASPVARFTQSVSNRTLSVDASTSTDSDGTIASYAWSWGDGQTGSGRTATHLYAADGSYQVRLTVTDDDGASSSTTQTVVIGQATGVLASDTFGRTATNGWGTAETGGPWTVSGTASQFSVTGGQGVITLPTAGTGRSAYLGGVSATDADVSAGIRMDKLANGGHFVGTIGRRVGTSEYRLKIKVAPDGSVTTYVTRVVNGTETTIQSTPVAGLVYAAGQRLNTRLQVIGTSPTTVRARVWLSTATEPTSWQVSATDGTSGLQSAGAVGVHAYVSGSATNPSWPVRFDDFLVPS